MGWEPSRAIIQIERFASTLIPIYSISEALSMMCVYSVSYEPLPEPTSSPDISFPGGPIYFKPTLFPSVSRNNPWTAAALFSTGARLSGLLWYVSAPVHFRCNESSLLGMRSSCTFLFCSSLISPVIGVVIKSGSNMKDHSLCQADSPEPQPRCFHQHLRMRWTHCTQRARRHMAN